MGFKAAASELGTEGGLRTRTDTDTVKAKSIRIRTYPYALETCLDAGGGGSDHGGDELSSALVHRSHKGANTIGNGRRATVTKATNQQNH